MKAVTVEPRKPGTDVIVECTGVGQVVADSIQAVARTRSYALPASRSAG
jgi:hypothetical protein